jgi:Stress responsive A/B Barrel Domain
MIRHVVMFRWKEGTGSNDVAAISAGLQTMPDLIPQLRAYRFGADLGINDANWDFVVVADFANTDDYIAYRDDANHRALINHSIAPHLEERASVQYEIH